MRFDTLHWAKRTGYLPVQNAPGIRAASIQTLLAIGKANDIEPFAWLKKTLENSPPAQTVRSTRYYRCVANGFPWAHKSGDVSFIPDNDVLFAACPAAWLTDFIHTVRLYEKQQCA